MKQRLKTMLTLLGLSITFVMFGAAQATQAATYTVDTTADDASLSACTDAANDCSLRGAINKATDSVNSPGADTINFDAAVFSSAQTIAFDDSSSNPSNGSPLTVNSDLTINGPGAGILTVKGSVGYAIPIFNISGGIVGISGLKLTGGSGKAIGSNNERYGGAVYMTGGTVSVAGSTFSGNSANNGGAVSIRNGSLNVTGSLFSGNTAYGTAGSGGAIYIDGGSMALKDSTISGNNISALGGGIYNEGATVTVVNSTISGNTAKNFDPTIYGWGGGIFTAGGSMTVTNSTISGNAALGSPTAGGSNSAGNTGGGGIWNDGTALTVANSTITGNYGLHGGGILILAGAVNLSNSIVAGNGATYGADIYGTVTSGDYNLVQDSYATLSGSHNITGQDPKLGALANNGGPTQTHALLSGSPAIDAGDPTFNATNTPYDQRGPGFPRVLGGRVDIGAYETELSQSVGGFVVNTLSDGDSGVCGSSNCTLREAVKYATAGANITFNVTGTITLTGGDLIIAKNLTIIGPASAPGITISGGGFSRIFTATAGTVNFSTLTLSGGNGVGGGTNSGNGGAIAIDPGAAATVTNSTFTGNNAPSGNGGAIRNGGALTVMNDTFSGNTAVNGGAIRNNGTLTVSNSTFSGNTASSIGGGIYNSGTLNLSNSIVAGNSAPTSPDISGTVTAGDYNIVQNISGATLSGTHNITGQDPKLDTLKSIGGPTATLALLSGSPAINAGDPSFNTAATPYDQRGSGYARKSGSVIDLGAFEVQLAPTAANVSVSGHVTNPSGRGITGINLSLTDSQGNTRTVVSTAGGYYLFTDVEAGKTYIISATGKRFTFSQAVQVLNVNEEATEVNFIADSKKRLRIF